MMSLWLRTAFRVFLLRRPERLALGIFLGVGVFGVFDMLSEVLGWTWLRPEFGIYFAVLGVLALFAPVVKQSLQSPDEPMNPLHKDLMDLVAEARRNGMSNYQVGRLCRDIIEKAVTSSGMLEKDKDEVVSA